MTGIFCLACKTFHAKDARCSPRALKAAGGGKESGVVHGRRAVPSASVPAKAGSTKRADAKPAPTRPNRETSGKSARAPQTITPVAKPNDGISLTSMAHPIDKHGPTGHGLRGRGRLHKAALETVEVDIPPQKSITSPDEALRKLEEIRARGAARAKKFRDKQRELKNA